MVSHCAVRNRLELNSVSTSVFEYGSDLANRVIVRCVYKGAQMIMPSPRGMTLVDYGDGAIDVTRNGSQWVPYS